jgi:hypothetical protein
LRIKERCTLDSERGRGEEELRGEAVERPATDPTRVDALGDIADDAWTATPRSAGPGVTRGGFGVEEEARLEESVRRGARRAIDEKEQEESGGGGLYGSQIDVSHIIGAPEVRPGSSTTGTDLRVRAEENS